MNVAETHPNNHAAAELIYRDKYGDWRIVIYSLQVPGILFNESPQTKTIFLYDFDFTLAVLKIFGHLIPTLRIDYGIYTDQQRGQINQHINQYCAETMTYFEIGHFRGDEFNTLPGPFKKVENVCFKLGKLNTENIRFNEIFPNVKRMDFGPMLFTHSSCFECNFTQLEHLDLNMFQGHNQSKLATTLEMNSHVRSISLYRASSDFLKTINDKVPNLESLEISYYFDVSDYEGEDIEFANLKNFTHKGQKSIDRIPLVMKRLEEFNYMGLIDLSWFDIMMQNIHMKRLTIVNLSQEQLMRIANELQELEEFTTLYYSDNLYQEVVQFMNTGKRLKKVLFRNMDKTTTQAVKQRFGAEWEVIALEMGEHVFVKIT